jgi:IS605 OrfB family transposase
VRSEQGKCAHPAIGLDVGVKVFLADSEGGMVENPRHHRRGQQRLAHAQRLAGRRAKGGYRRRKANREVACQHLKISRQRRDFHFKTAKRYAEDYSRICVEDLTVAGMETNHCLTKRIHDAAWSAFLAILEDEAARADHRVIRVPARFTTQKCHRCGEHVQQRAKLERANASLSLLRPRGGPRCERRQKHLTGGAPPSGTDGQWPAGCTETPPALAVGSRHNGHAHARYITLAA